VNPIVRAQLDEFKKLNSAETLTDAEFFEVFSIYAVENGTLTQTLNPFDVHLKGSEFGLDGIAILIQNELCRNTDECDDILQSGKNHTVEFHFFQSKTSESVDYGDLSKFLDAVYDFFGDGHLAKSEQVTDLQAVKDRVYVAATKSNPKLKCFYATTGTASIADPIQKLIESNRARLDTLSLFSEIDIQLIGAKQLQSGYRAATNSFSATIAFPNPITLPSHPRVSEAFIGLLEGKELMELATTKDEATGERSINRAVFYDNIRDFNPNSEINKGILEQVKAGDAESFVFKNNGVTVIAKSINRTRDTFRLEDFQIVNGCQTTNILFAAGEAADGISVPFRLVVSNDSDFVASIIIGTNRQNEVKEDQFWALSPFMKDLEEYCRSQAADQTVFVERRENQYRELSVERTRLFKPAEILKSVAAMYLHQPNRAARDYRGIRKEFAESVFQSTHNVELYHRAALASYRFDFAVRNGRVDKSRGIYKYYALYALGRMAHGDNSLLGAHRKVQEKSKGVIDAIINDETKWQHHIEAVASILDKHIADQGIATRERVRDYLRTESALEAFRIEWQSQHVR
jgi:hypothetical protein